MDFDVYCDEAYPDLFTSSVKNNRFMVIGSLWLPIEKRSQFKTDIHNLRDRYKIGSEFKWQKITPSKLDFYISLTDWFFKQKNDLRFRAIVVDSKAVNMKYHGDDAELGFYKFYYQNLHKWIYDNNSYNIFCDYKTNRIYNRLPKLKEVLGNANLFAEIKNLQAVRSKESVLIQLVDVLTGAIAAKFNNTLNPKSAKSQFISHLESKLPKKEILPTMSTAKKVNIFKILLEGGW